MSRHHRDKSSNRNERYLDRVEAEARRVIEDPEGREVSNPKHALRDQFETFSNRPSKKDRQRYSREKPSWAARLRGAAMQGTANLTSVANAAPDSIRQLVLSLACEMAQMRGQTLKVGEDLQDKGFLPSGEFIQDLRNGALHLNQGYINFNNVVVETAMLKSAELGIVEPPPPANAPLLDRVRYLLMPTYTKVFVPRGQRYVSTPAEQEVRDTDIAGYRMRGDGGPVVVQGADWPEGAPFIPGYDPAGPIPASTYKDSMDTWAPDLRKVKGRWAIGAIVWVGTSPRLVFDWKAMIKVLASIILITREEDLAKVGGVMTETLGHLIGADGHELALIRSLW